jgi:ATP-dependent DNA helicase RecG
MSAAAAKAAARPAGRPEVLFPLFAELATLPGIGPRLAKLLAKLGLEHVVDLLFYRPNRIIDRRYRPHVAEAEIGRIATLHVTVDGHQPPPNRRQPYKVRVRDETGFMTLAFFHADGTYMNRMLPVGETRWISGTVDEFQGERQMAHPDFIVTEEDFATLPDYEPVYPLTAGLSNKVVRRAAQAICPNGRTPPFAPSMAGPTSKRR